MEMATGQATMKAARGGAQIYGEKSQTTPPILHWIWFRASFNNAR
jgi:hypothetical protein